MGCKVPGSEFEVYFIRMNVWGSGLEEVSRPGGSQVHEKCIPRQNSPWACEGSVPYKASS